MSARYASKGGVKSPHVLLKMDDIALRAGAKSEDRERIRYIERRTCRAANEFDR